MTYPPPAPSGILRVMCFLHVGICRRALLLFVGVLLAAPAAAQERGSVSVAIDGTTLKLSTVTYKPAGTARFPP